MDRQELFMNHVNRVEVPDYYQVIKEPMCWSSIDAKLDSNQYQGAQEFQVSCLVLRCEAEADMQRDVNLVLDNAMIYNPPDNPYHRLASRIKSNAAEILDQLDELPAHMGATDGVGNLEPARVLLEVLTSRATANDERDRLADLFAFEMAKPKEPTPAPPTPPPKPTIKRDTYADRKRRLAEKEAAHQARAVAPGRATRAGHAMVEAFKHEAGLPPSSDNEVDTPGAGSSNRRRTRPSTVGNAESSTNTKTSLQVPSREDRTSASSGLSRSRSQVGVARTETVERLSDKERRERERNLVLTTDSVGDADQFTRFNVGWVLPEGSKRNRGGARPDPPRPVPKPSESSCGC